MIDNDYRLKIWLKYKVLEGDFIEYYVNRGRNGGRPKRKYGWVVEKDNKLMIKLIGYKSTYAKLYSGITKIIRLSKEEERKVIINRQINYIKHKIIYILYIINNKKIEWKNKFWYIGTYGFNIKGIAR